MEEAELSHIDAREVVFRLMLGGTGVSRFQSPAAIARLHPVWNGIPGASDIGSFEADASRHAVAGWRAIWLCVGLFCQGMPVDAFTKTSRQKTLWWICQAPAQRNSAPNKPVGILFEELQVCGAPRAFFPRKAKTNQLNRLKDGGDAQSPASVKLIDFDTAARPLDDALPPALITLEAGVAVAASQVENWEPHSPKAKDVLGTDGYIAPEAYLGASDLGKRLSRHALCKLDFDG